MRWLPYLNRLYARFPPWTVRFLPKMKIVAVARADMPRGRLIRIDGELFRVAEVRGCEMRVRRRWRLW